MHVTLPLAVSPVLYKANYFGDHGEYNIAHKKHYIEPRRWYVEAIFITRAIDACHVLPSQRLILTIGQISD